MAAVSPAAAVVLRRPSVLARLVAQNGAWRVWTTFGLLAPALRAQDAALADDIDAKFAAVQSELATLKKGDAYPNYDDVDDAERIKLADVVARLARPLTKISQTLGS